LPYDWEFATEQVVGPQRGVVNAFRADELKSRRSIAVKRDRGAKL
jgi:hypothetical protein